MSAGRKLLPSTMRLPGPRLKRPFNAFAWVWSGRTMARFGLRMMRTSPSSPPKIPYGGFSLGTAPKLAYQIGPSLIARRLSLLPAYPPRDQVCLHPSCSPQQHGSPVLGRRPPARWNTAMRATHVALLQGPSLRSELCCPGQSSPNRPHPPHSQAHHNFIASDLYVMPSLCGSA